MLGRFHQLETKKLIAYSSVFRAVWVLSSATDFFVSIQYLRAYALALLILIGPLFVENRLNINEILTKAHKRKIFIYLVGFFSLGGSPPFLGFYAKVIVAQILLANSQVAFLMVLVRSAVLLLYVYMRFFFQALTVRRTRTETRVTKFANNGALILVLIALGVFP